MAADAPPAVRLRGVAKGFGLGSARIEALAPLDLDIEAGRTTALVGPSGCGKSTLLRMIAGLEELSDGEILFGGQPVDHLSPRDRNIAMVFQSYALYPHMTVAQNMAFNLKIAGVPAAERERRVAEAAKLLEGPDGFDALFTDVQMPGTLDGLDVALHLRRQHPATPVLIVSGYAETDGIASDLPRLTKPFRNAELAERVSELMQNGAA